MQADQFFAWYRKQTERIGVAQIGLGRERKARDIGERLELLGLCARRVEFRAQVRDFGIGARERLSEPGKLQRGQVGARHGFGLAVEHVVEGVGGSALDAHDDVDAGERRGYINSGWGRGNPLRPREQSNEQA